MKKYGRFLILLFLFAIISAFSLTALPKVAVLDAVIPQDMDKSVIIPVTDKIAEQMVSSHKYIVLDRSNIAQVLKEKEFQVSGLVSDREIKKAGEYLGADFVVVARVSQVGDTYFISAKMISVETGEVTAQTSDQQEGKLSDLILLAERVGKKLVGGVIEPAKKPVARGEEKKKAPAGARVAAIPGEKKGLRSRISFLVGLPMFSGKLADAVSDWTDYWTNALSIDYSTSAFSVGVHVVQYLLGPVYVSGEAGYSSNTINYYLTSDMSEPLSTVIDASVGAGAGFSVSPSMQVYGGIKGGVIYAELGDFWNDYNWTLSWVGYSDLAFGYGIEAGLDFFLLDFLPITIHAEWFHVTIPSDGDIASTTIFVTPYDTYLSPFSLDKVTIFAGTGFAY